METCVVTCHSPDPKSGTEDVIGPLYKKIDVLVSDITGKKKSKLILIFLVNRLALPV